MRGLRRLPVGQLNQFRVRLIDPRKHRIGTERFQHGNLVAALEFRAAEAVFPDLKGELPAFYRMKTEFPKESWNIGECEKRMQAVLDGFLFQRLYDPPSQTLRFNARIDGQRTYFGGGWRIEVQGAATDQLCSCISHAEIANILRHFKFRPWQHDSIRGVIVDQRKQIVYVGHPRLADDQRHVGNGERGSETGATHANELLIPRPNECLAEHCYQ